MKKWMLFILGLLTVVLLAGCSASGDTGEPTKLSFATSASLEEIGKLNGKSVTIAGYMATLSPLDGSYIYLMNMPYQSCPFCVPNTQQLSNTMAVYAADGSKFDFTDRPVKITGTMKVEDTTDDYGYEYNYRIVNASYEVVNLSDVSREYALYQSLAEDGVIGDVNSMFDYLMFISQWTEYMGTATDEDGNVIRYYLYPGDVQQILDDDSAYGYKTEASEDYFPSLIRRVEAISLDELTALTDIIRHAQEAEKTARAALESGEYTYDAEADKYTLNDSDGLYEGFRQAYLEFSDWLQTYEL